VGVVGGGQLGQMMALAAHRLGVKLTCLDPGGLASPTGKVCGAAVTGGLADGAAIRKLAAEVDVLTVEIEHIDTASLAAIEAEGKVAVHPSPRTLATIQAKISKAHRTVCSKKYVGRLEVSVCNLVLMHLGKDTHDLIENSSSLLSPHLKLLLGGTGFHCSIALLDP